MKSVLLLKLSDLDSAPRVHRTYEAIKNDFAVTTAGYSPLGVTAETFINLKQFANVTDWIIDFHLKYPVIIRKAIAVFIQIFILKKFNNSAYLNKKYWSNKNKQIFNFLKEKKYDIIIAHGLDVLPIAFKLSKQHNSKLVFNAHEYYPREFDENKKWVEYEKPLNEYLCKEYLKKVDLFFCVTESISAEYKKMYNVNPITITNAAAFKNLKPIQSGDKVKIIHHGAALRGRKIEEMISCAKLLDERFTFNLMLMPTDENYYKELTEKYSDDERINIIPSVEYKDIIDFLNNYQIGLYLLPNTSFNNEMALPNKFFEFVQARLMIAISPNHEMAAIVKKYNLGLVAKDYDFHSLAKEINQLNTEDILAYQRNANVCAQELNAEKNAEIILKELKTIS